MLKDKILKFLKLDGFVESLVGYVESRVELLKVEVKEEIVKLLVKASLFFIIIISFLFFLVFASAALALWIGELTGLIGSFAIVAGIYLLIMIILFSSRESIKRNLKRRLLEEVKQKK